MNSQNKSKLRCALAAGLLLSAMAASASSVVTFNVDMSSAAFDPASQTVIVRGSFNNWSGTDIALTNNPSGANPTVWSGTFSIPTNGIAIAYKYVIETGDTYESIGNRDLLLPATSGASVAAPLAFWNDAGTVVTTSVKFQVDMAQQINVGKFDPVAGVVQARAAFNGWGGTAIALTNDPTILRTNQFGLVTSNVYVGTFDVTGPQGQTTPFKFHFDPNDTWEAPNPVNADPYDSNENRFFNLGAGPTQELPIVFFSDSPYSPVATNNVTFQVDMSAAIADGSFVPGSSTVQVNGDFNGWGGTANYLTNDPAALNTNIYTGTVTLSDGVGATHYYKFWASAFPFNGGWEVFANNRALQIVSGNTLVLPVVPFNNLRPGDVLTQPTTVTFSVDMTGAVSTSGGSGSPITFDPSVDSVFIGGFGTDAAHEAWLAPFAAGDPQSQLSNDPVGSSNYTVQVTLPAGYPVLLNYKYGLDGFNNEPGGNHVRVVYTAGNYVMPKDKWGVPSAAEPLVPRLNIAKTGPSQITLTWLGRPGVHLQTKTGLNASWVDHMETDGTSSENWSVNGDAASFFRLVKP